MEPAEFDVGLGDRPFFILVALFGKGVEDGVNFFVALKQIFGKEDVGDGSGCIGNIL